MERAALDYLDELTGRPDIRLDMDFEPGDIQLCNNYTSCTRSTALCVDRDPNPIRSAICSGCGS